MTRRAAAVFLSVALTAGAALVPACLARGDEPFELLTKSDAGPPDPTFVEAGRQDVRYDVPELEPHAVQGVDPPHGPFSGELLALIRGNGFGSDARVWFGDREVPADDVLPVDPLRVQVTVPPGPPGPVDVTVMNGDDESTRRTLAGGFSYDAFYAKPSSGPTSGGTLVNLIGSGTSWGDDTEVLIDFEPCQSLEVHGPELVTCATPPSTPGTKSIRVSSGGTSIDVLDAFTYGDSDNGYRGGLGGDPLGDELRVIVLDAFTGTGVPLASVILDDDLGSVQLTDGKGVTTFSGSTLGPQRSVTIAKKCFQPVTFVDVPVDTVTVYVAPVLSPICADEGDLPPTGGTPGLSSEVRGELLWEGGIEFKREGWTNVPAPKGEDEEFVAYVFRLSSTPDREFRLPNNASAVTPDAGGDVGFEFSYSTSAGNVTLYALAGIENRAVDPPMFVAYAMGIAKGIGVPTGGTADNVFVEMNIPLDQALTIELTGPSPTAKGPDRALTSVAVRVGDQGYAILPVGTRPLLLPVTEPVRFVGLPPLAADLVGAEYVISASAVTGEAKSTPKSIVGSLATNSASGVIRVDGFVEIPQLVTPALNEAFNGVDIELDWVAGGAPVDLTTIEIQSGSGLVIWDVAVPLGKKLVKLPDLAQLGSELALRRGPLTVTVNAAHIADFDYGSLSYRDLSRNGWNAYATDVFYAYY